MDNFLTLYLPGLGIALFFVACGAAGAVIGYRAASANVAWPGARR